MPAEDFDRLGIDELARLLSEVDRRDFQLDLRAARTAVLAGFIAHGASPDEELICMAFPSLDTMPEAKTDLEYANQVLAAFGLSPIEPKE